MGKLNIVYKPKGKALEYSPLAANLYTGCAHGCKYCYAPSCLRMDRAEFYGNPRPRPNAIRLLEADCKKLSGSKDRVLLCFTCDPYQPLDDEHQLTRRALELFNEYDIPFQVLTKGGMRAARDFDLYRPGDAFATTLTLRGKDDSLKMEPGAAKPSDRMAAIQCAHKRGIETWVSFEPVLDDDQVMAWLNDTYPFVDLYKVGKVSRFAPLKPIDWAAFVRRIVARLEELGKKYYIKEDLRKYLDG